MAASLRVLLIACVAAFVALKPVPSLAREATPVATMPAVITLATARVLAQNLLGADVDDNGNITFGSDDQALAPTMRLRRDFWCVEFALIYVCFLFGGSNSKLAMWARAGRMVAVLVGVSLTLWTLATLLPQLAAPPPPPQG